MSTPTFGGFELRTREEIAEDNKAEADAETEAILSYMDYENPQQYCRNCGSERFERNGDIERCADCGR